MALPPELQALNITPQQMAVLLGHFQAGTFPFPPPPPPPPPPQSYQSAAAFAPVSFPPPVPTHAAFAQHQSVPTAIPSHMEIDREEGEVSDASQHVNRVSAPTSKKRKSRTSQLTNRPAPQPSPSSTPTKNTSDLNQPSVQQKREAVLPFIAALHQEGFTFDEFVREGFDENLLRQVYQELHIPIPSPQVSSAQASAAETMPVKTISAVPTQPSVAVPAKEIKPVVPIKQAAPVSRQDYLARLQAAKNKKAEAAPSKGPILSANSATPPPAKSEDAPPPVKMPTPVQPKIENAQTAVPASVAASIKQSQTTELIRKKMEALKATQRRFANNTPSGSSTPGSLPTAAQSQVKITPPPPTGSFSGTPQTFSQLANVSLIPGLRMSTSAAKSPQPQLQAQSAVLTASSTGSTSAGSSKDVTPQPAVTSSVHMVRQRPVASDLNEAQNISDHHPFKRPFGKSRQNSFDAAMIIQVSDDEDTSDDDNDELSSTKPSVNASTALTGQRNKNISELPALRDFPQRSAAFQKQPGIFTPPLGTPGLSSDAEELRRKELEITSLNQRIQEYEKRKAALKAKASRPESQPQTPSQMLPASEKTSALPTPSAAAPQSRSKEPADRRTELKAALTARNADIDNQKARILEMQKQMADLQRQYDQDMENQQKLREELESLDVDTEGMTQSEMEAKKQEIEDLQDSEVVGSASNRAHADNSLSVTGRAENNDMDVSMSESDSDSSADGTAAMHQPETSRRHRDATTSSPGRARFLDDIRADRAKVEQDKSQVDESSSDSDSGSSMSESSESEDDDEEGPESDNNMATDASDGDLSRSENVESVSKPVSAEPEVVESQDNLAWLFIRNLPYSATDDLLRSFFGTFDV